MSNKRKSAVLCEHANEVPAMCNCSNDCYCKSHTCKKYNPKTNAGPYVEAQLLLAKQLCGRKVRNKAYQRDVTYLLGDIKRFAIKRHGDSDITEVEYIVKHAIAVHGHTPEYVILDMTVVRLLILTGNGEKMPPNPDEGTWEIIGGTNEAIKTKTLGETRVRTEFNVSKDAIVDKLKQKTAELINLCEELKAKAPREASIAQTEYESAAHWAVKAATA